MSTPDPPPPGGSDLSGTAVRPAGSRRRGPPFEISVVTCAYNEAHNVENMLRAVLSETGGSFRVREVVVVASGCTDGTDNIVLKVSADDPRVVALIQPKRQGKAAALQVGVHRASGDIILVEGADTLPARGSYEEVARGFLDPSVDVVCFHPIPVPGVESFTGTLGRMLWEVHHRVSLAVPKVGEAYAVRSDSADRLLGSEDDDVRLGGLVRDQSVRSVYAPNAVVYNQVPSTFREYVLQRIRINGLIYRVRSQEGLYPPSWDMAVVLTAFAGYLRLHPRDLLPLTTLVALEVLTRVWAGISSRAWGVPDPNWEQLRTTKGHIDPPKPTTEGSSGPGQQGSS
ncbi:MAG: glycosyltransferase [Thermoplasmata archaeon]